MRIIEERAVHAPAPGLSHVKFLDGNYGTVRDIERLKQTAYELHELEDECFRILQECVPDHEFQTILDWIARLSGTPNPNHRFWVMVAFAHELEQRRMDGPTSTGTASQDDLRVIMQQIRERGSIMGALCHFEWEEANDRC